MTNGLMKHQAGRRSLVAAALGLSLGLAGLCTPAWSQEFPAGQPVKIVVPFPPGGTTDILARALAPELTRAFGQSFVVENRAGAGGNIGAEIAARAPAVKPDPATAATPGAL